jgi:hypothetical protein
LVDKQTQRPLGELQLLLIPREGSQPNLRLNTQSNALLDPVAPGLYDVQLTKPGYQSLRIPSIRVLTGKTTLLTLTVPPQKQNLDEVVVVGTTLGDDLLSSVDNSDIDREAQRIGQRWRRTARPGRLARPLLPRRILQLPPARRRPRDNLILVDGIPFDNLVHFSESFREIEELEAGGRDSIFAPNLIARAQ